MMDNTRIAHAIQNRRDALRLSMRAAAAMGGVSPTTWSDLEAGKYPPTPATQRKVATALRWPIDWIDVVVGGGEPVSLPADDLLDQLRSQLAGLTERVERMARWVKAHDERLVGQGEPAERQSAQGHR